MSKILIVEDSVTQREIISDFLQNNGLEVVMAKDGVEALDYLQNYSPDLVVLDVVMPRMNGYEVCRNLKSNSQTKSVPVIMCSSKKEEFDRYWGMRQGADAYLIKPFKPAEFISTIKKLLNQ